LAGRRPFVGSSAAEVIMQAVRSDPTPLVRLRPDIDPSLANIVHRCLEREPDWRYPDAIALRDDLVAFRDGRRVAAPPDTRYRRWQRFARRHPWQAGLGVTSGALAIALVALAAAAAWYARDQASQAQDFMGFAARIESSARFE